MFSFWLRVCVLEHWLALELQERKLIEAIVPVFVGLRLFF
jgi:hypothetical protein